MTTLPANAKETLLCLFLHGPTFDGDVPSKSGRDTLYELGLIDRGDGYQWLTRVGVKLCLELKFAVERSRRRHAEYQAHTRALNTGFDDDEG